MAMRSIFQRACPACSTLVESDAKRCNCGYSFDTQSQENQFLPEDQAVQDEQLLKEYLDARIGQAVSELETIQASLTHDPKNLDKANHLLHAFAQVRDLRAELETQTKKITDAKIVARAARLDRGLTV